MGKKVAFIFKNKIILKRMLYKIKVMLNKTSYEI